jgi:hypothetical protein
MNSLWQAATAVVALLSWLAAPPTSLAEVAQKEAVRRQMTAKSVATYSNDDLPANAPGDTISIPGGAFAAARIDTAPPPDDDDDVPKPKPVASPAAAAPAPVAAEPAMDEQGWRDRMSTARQTLESNEQMAEGMQSRVSALQTDVTNRDDPAQQATLRTQLQRALAELDRLKKQIETDKKAIAKVQDDARRKGVPPGWVR